jgi:uncharacterized protein YndB with AHSA1/START domain
MSNTNAPTVAALVLRRTYKAPIQRVFDAWTNPVTLQRWFCPDDMTIPEMHFDPQVGAPYRITMRKSDGELFIVFGQIREVRSPERLRMTWQWEDDDGKPEGNETLLTLDFHARGNETELVLTHENLTNEESRAGHERGWNQGLDKLAKQLSS